jgi:hypothetical protein
MRLLLLVGLSCYLFQAPPLAAVSDARPSTTSTGSAQFNAGVSWEKVLGLSVLGAVVTTAGALLALVLKERVFARSFEKWKAAMSLEQIARRYREPIALTALELSNRLSTISEDYPASFLSRSVLETSAPSRPTLNSAADPYFQRYRLISSVYRLCAFLGWIELYRQEMTYLEPRGRSRAVETSIFEVRADLADGQLNKSEDWDAWHDALIFREEQRAIGEVMIVQIGDARTVMGYAEFSELFPGTGATLRERWFGRAGAFLLDPIGEKDFRLVRLQRLVVHLVDLAELLVPDRVREDHREARARCALAIAG